MIIDSTLFDKEVVVVHEIGKRLKCTKDMQEADLCEPCDYKIKRSSVFLTNIYNRHYHTFYWHGWRNAARPVIVIPMFRGRVL